MLIGSLLKPFIPQSGGAPRPPAPTTPAPTAPAPATPPVVVVEEVVVPEATSDAPPAAPGRETTPPVAATPVEGETTAATPSTAVAPAPSSSPPAGGRITRPNGAEPPAAIIKDSIQTGVSDIDKARRAALAQLERDRLSSWIARLQEAEVPSAIALMRRDDDGAKAGYAAVVRAYGEDAPQAEKPSRAAAPA